MWILLLIILSGPEQVDNVKVLKIVYGKQECFSEVDRALKVGLPPRSSISCIPISGVSKVERK